MKIYMKNINLHRLMRILKKSGFVDANELFEFFVQNFDNFYFKNGENVLETLQKISCNKKPIKDGDIDG